MRETTDGTIIQEGEAERIQYKGLEEVQKVFEKKGRYQLEKRRGVLATGYGLKIQGGEITDRVCMIAYVSKKGKPTDFDVQDLIPQEIEGIETDVVEVGEFRAQNVNAKSQNYPERTKTYDGVIPLGVSGGCKTGVTAGTIGGLARRNGKLYWVTNAHVGIGDVRVNNSDWDATFIQAGDYDGGGNIIGLRRYVTKLGTTEISNARVDCALIEVGDVEKATANQLGIGEYKGLTIFELGDKLIKGGRTTDVTRGTVTGLGVSSNVGYGNGVYQTFVDQIAITDMSDGGDSGSFVARENDMLIGGLLYAGSSTTTLCNPIQHVQNVMSCEIVWTLDESPEPPQPPEPPEPPEPAEGKVFELNGLIAGVIPIKATIREVVD